MECVRSARCPLPALICLLLASPPLPGVRGQTLSVHQPQGSVSVSVGGSVTLNCTVTGAGPPGGVRWFRENGGPRKEFFSFVNQKPDRVSQVISGSSSDFSIIIISITRQDNGTYTCVKFRRTAAGEEEFRSGGGTVLYVTAPPSPPAVTVPRGRVPTGQSVNYTCRSDGFTPQNVTVAWMKGGDRIPAAQTDVLPGTDGMFSLRSTATVTLHRQDLLSHVTCLIQHQALSSPLNGTLLLSDIITGDGEMMLYVAVGAGGAVLLLLLLLCVTAILVCMTARKRKLRANTQSPRGENQADEDPGLIYVDIAHFDRSAAPHPAPSADPIYEYTSVRCQNRPADQLANSSLQMTQLSREPPKPEADPVVYAHVNKRRLIT
ncbi:signal-regulatory protein beta-1 isoform X2 [Ascaphus truei]|uniref:signal-regulatory protein beta-1 isoform X2 n=1 Tax=Ascaphus truei TaxID=8439 RepID=UPI003F5A6350